ncbi:CAAX protease family protein [Sphingomonas sp. F9_3S_D5_B_2]
MTDSQTTDVATELVVLGLGLLLGLATRRRFDLRWLLAGIALLVINNLLLSRFYGLVPRLPDLSYNWTGKVLALAGTLAIASVPMFGWRRVGLTLAHREGSLRSAIPVALFYCAIFVLLASLFPADAAKPEDYAFQLTLPGLEEEPFFRGILLFAFDQAFRGRIRFLGVDWGWGAVLSSVAFGLVHAFGYGGGAFSFDPLYFALTAGPSFVAIWVRYRTGSLLLPVIMHNFGNSIGLFL